MGPGVIFAANAVGVSHLVQSTRSGAGYGLALAGIILMVTIIKYPLFRFACLYSAASGKTLLEGYRSEGPFAAALLIISVAIDMFIATAAVSLVTAGIVKNILLFFCRLYFYRQAYSQCIHRNLILTLILK